MISDQQVVIQIMTIEKMTGHFPRFVFLMKTEFHIQIYSISLGSVFFGDFLRIVPWDSSPSWPTIWENIFGSLF